MILKEVKTNLILKIRFAKTFKQLSEFEFRYSRVLTDKRKLKIACIVTIINGAALLSRRLVVKIPLESFVNDV